MSKHESLILKSEDIFILLNKLANIGWNTVRQSSINRIMYLAAVLYSFRYPNIQNIFEGDYHFSRTLRGPEDVEIENAIIHLSSNELLEHTEDGYASTSLAHIFSLPENYKIKEPWFKDIAYILGIYGEDKIFDFIFRDPEYKNSVESNSVYNLNIGSKNDTVKFLNTFKEAFEKNLTKKNNILDNKDYLKLYFEYIFGKILRGER